MRENSVRRQSDRSYLCIVAIYAIHALLTNVVILRPNLNNAHCDVTLASSYVNDARTRGLTMSIMKNFSDNVIARIDARVDQNDTVASWNRTDSREYVDGRNIPVIDNGRDDCSSKLTENEFSQSKSGGAAIHFLASGKTFSVSRSTNTAMITAISIIEGLSPAELGIIAGCLVFILTFTENDYV